MIILVDRELCIGAAPCVAVAPDVFQLDEEGKAYVVDKKGTDRETIIMAAESCPTVAIFLYEDDGTVIYPKDAPPLEELQARSSVTPPPKK